MKTRWLLAGCATASLAASAAPAAAHVADLKKLSDSFFESRMGNAERLSQMQQPQCLGDGSQIGAALGIEHKRLGRHDAISHTSVTVGTRAAFVRFPAQQTALAVLCSRMDVNTERRATQIADELFPDPH